MSRQAPIFLNGKFVMPVKKKSTPTDILSKFFARDYRVKLPDHAGIVTACDKHHFVGFQLLYCSIQLGWEVNVALVDLGLTQNQIDWCERQPNIILMREFDRPFPATHARSYTWNKPFYLSNAPFSQVLWLDSDIVVNRNLEALFDHIERAPLLTSDIQPSCTEYLFRLMPVSGARTEFPPYINAGVVGLNKNRPTDDLLLEQWKYAVNKASRNHKIEENMLYWDQSALKWAIYNTGTTKFIQTHEINNKFMFGHQPMNLFQFVGYCHAQKENILHFAGGKVKPWQRWGELVNFDLDHEKLQTMTYSREKEINQFAENCTLYVLHNKQEMLDTILDKPFLSKVNLTRLPVPREMQGNEMCENKYYYCKQWELHDKPYIGFCSARWNTKYPDLPNIEQLYLFNPLLAPKKIYCAHVSDPDWMYFSEVCHQGISVYLLDMANHMGWNADAGPGFWANNYICHIDVFREFMDYWRAAFDYLYGKYGFNLDYPCPVESARPAYLFERITTMYFANRKDLELIQMPRYDELVNHRGDGLYRQPSR